jgi:hypothetical protein
LLVAAIAVLLARANSANSPRVDEKVLEAFQAPTNLWKRVGHVGLALLADKTRRHCENN